MANDVEVQIGANVDPLTRALSEAKQAVLSATGEMRTAFSGVTSAFEKIRSAAVGLTALLAGGALFKDVIESTVNWGEGTIKLSRALGVSTQGAVTYQVALQHLGISNETLISAADKLAKQIHGNSAAFEKAGIATKDSGGHFRAVGDILKDVTTYLNSINDPIERNIAGMQFFGRGWAEVREILKLAGDELLNAAKKAEQLGLVTGASKEQIEAYKHGMNDLKLTVMAFEFALGKSLLPTLTNVANTFAEAGPRGLDTFGNLLKIVAYVAGTVAIEFEKMGLWIGKLAAQSSALVHGDFGNIGRIQRDFNTDLIALNKNADELWEKLNRKPPAQASEAPPPPGSHDFDSKDKEKSRLGDWQTALEQEKAVFQESAAAEGQLREYSKSLEKQYWQWILDTTKLSGEELKEVRAKIAGAELAIDKAKLEGSLAALKTDESAHGANIQARLQAEQTYAEAVKGVYGADSKEYAEAQRTIIETKREEVKQEQELDAIRTATAKQAVQAQIATEEEIAKERYDRGAISLKQLIGLEKSYEDQKYQLELQALEREKALVNPDTDPVKYAQMLQQIQQLQTQHNAQILKLDQQLTSQQTALFRQFEQTLTSGMATAFSGIIERTETVRKAFTKLFASMIQIVLEFLAKQLAQFLISQAEQLIGIKTTATAQAGQAATGAMASVAAIPWVGWALAPEVGASIFAEAEGFAAAAQGYDIPSTVNPLLQAHASEMVLPADIATPLRRSLTQPGGGGLGGKGDMHVHLGPNIDSSSMRRALRKGGSLEKEIRRLHRSMVR